MKGTQSMGSARGMRILLTTGVYPPDIGGPSLQTKQIAENLTRRGHTVCVLALGGKGVIREGDYEVHWLPGERGKSLGRKVSNSFRLWLSVYTICRRFRPDVVHMQTAAGPFAYIVGAVCRNLGIPAMLKYSSDNSGEAAVRPYRRAKLGWLKLSQETMFALYPRIWVTTPTFRERARSVYGVSDSRLHLQPNFIDLGRFDGLPAERMVRPPLRLLSVVRLKPKKGVDVCIRSLMHMTDLDVTLRIVGDGDSGYRRKLEELAESLGVADRVEFSGAVPPADVPPVFADADIFLLCSRDETFGIVLVEAMAARLPTVAAAVGGIPFVTDEGRTALLVPSEDPAAVAAAVRRLACEPELRQQLIEAGTRRASEFSLEQGIEGLLNEYSRLSRSGRFALLGRAEAH